MTEDESFYMQGNNAADSFATEGKLATGHAVAAQVATKTLDQVKQYEALLTAVGSTLGLYPPARDMYGVLAKQPADPRAAAIPFCHRTQTHMDKRHILMRDLPQVCDTRHQAGLYRGPSFRA